MRYLLLLLLVGTGLGHAEPATFSSVIAPTFNAPLTGTPDGYRLYQGCDVVTDTVGALVDGAYTSGTPYSIAGDTNSPPILCIVAFNANGEGPFDVAWQLSATLTAPGPIQGLVPGSCTVVPGTGGNVYTCDFTVIPNP